MNAHVKPKLLIVEDDEGLQRQLRWAYDDYEVLVASDRDAAIDLLRAEEPAVVTLDLGLPPDPDGVTEGFAALETILALKPDTKVIVASGHGARESALRAIASGAYDFYQKPVDIDQLGLIVRRAFQLHGIEDENRRLEEQVGDDRTVLGTMITAAPEMLEGRAHDRAGRQYRRLGDAARRQRHRQGIARPRRSTRRAAARGGGFVAINCAAIPENLLEAELFGYEKGAFTGAIKTTEGKIELAHGGTLFLDEVGDIPLPLQVKLLRFLQERVIERIGGRKPIAVDTRIVCATHQNLRGDDRGGHVPRGPLLPPRRDRRAHPEPRRAATATRRCSPSISCSRFAREMNPQVKGFAPGALAAIDDWPWPGNVRELENRMKRAVIMADGKLITAEDLDLAARAEAALPVNLKAAREAADRQVIRKALAQTDDNISSAAKLLGISRPTLYDLLKQYGLQP